MSDTIVIVEGKDDVKELTDIMHASNDVKIISFDFYAHKSLNKLEIKHEIIEEYFSNDDQLKLDNLALKLATTWYKQKNLTSFLEYDGLNLGCILEIEIIGYFFLHLKRTLGIIRILEKEQPKKIISSSLGNFVKIICVDKKIEVITHEVKITSSLHFDKIQVPIEIGHKVISLKISRNQFLLLKKLFETITNIFFNLKPNIHTNKKSTLLLDFNPVMYENLLRTLSAQQNIILLNQRRPAIWNFESLNIVRRFKCEIVRLDDYYNSEAATKIEEELQNFKHKLNTLWLNDKILHNIFSVEGYSFWNAIRDNFIEIITKRFNESITRLLLLKELFNQINVNCILEWAHVGAEEKIIHHVLDDKIPIVFLQHGLFIMNTKFEKYVPIFPIIPSHGAKEAVWGNITKNYLLEHGVNNTDILLTGSPRHDVFFKLRNNMENNNTILIATNGFFLETFSGNDTRSYELLENCVKRILEILKNVPNKKPVIKLHPGQGYHDIKSLIRESDPTIPIYQNQNILNLIKSCDCVISLNFSTVLLDAMILNKPTMVILAEEQNYEEDPMIKRKATMPVFNLKNLDSALNDLLFNTKIREGLIQKGNEFVNDYFVNQGNASKYLLEILRKY